MKGMRKRRVSPYERYGIVMEERELKYRRASKREGGVFLAIVAPLFLPPPSGMETTEERVEEMAISEEESWGVEWVMGQLEKKGDLPEKLYLLIETRGGSGASAYTIARILRKRFKIIKAFVPHQALSAGTLIAVAADEIVMDISSNLGPFDAQVELPNYGVISASRLERGLTLAEKYYQKRGVLNPKEFVREKLDPVLYGLLEEAQRAGEMYLQEILISAHYPKKKAERIAHKLVWEFPSHEFPITIERAKELGLKVVSKEKYPVLWKLMCEWLDKLAFHPKNVDHLIAYTRG